jgi:hypothetical protein
MKEKQGSITYNRADQLLLRIKKGQDFNKWGLNICE